MTAAPRHSLPGPGGWGGLRRPGPASKRPFAIQQNPRPGSVLLSIRWRRVLALAGFGVLVALLTLDGALAWRYVRALTHPPCSPSPTPLAGFAQPEIVTLESTDGRRLPGWYYPSRNGAAVIALGGLGGALGDQLPWGTPLLEAGYGVLQVGSRACADPPAPVTLGYDEALDAAAALAYLQGRPEVDPARIGVMGFSMGGVAAIRAAARQPEIAAVVAEGGYFNLGDDIVEADRRLPVTRKILLYTIAVAFWAQTGVNPWDSSPLDDLPRLHPRPVLLIYGQDEVADGRAFRQYAAARQPKVLWVVAGGDHGRNHLVAPEAYARRVVAFFDQALAPEHPSNSRSPPN